MGGGVGAFYSPHTCHTSQFLKMLALLQPLPSSPPASPPPPNLGCPTHPSDPHLSRKAPPAHTRTLSCLLLPPPPTSSLAKQWGSLIFQSSPSSFSKQQVDGEREKGMRRRRSGRRKGPQLSCPDSPPPPKNPTPTLCWGGRAGGGQELTQALEPGSGPLKPSCLQQGKEMGMGGGLEAA